ncbi:DUF3887 domain-containing protein [Methanococcoides seepicolus]|uniref:DUF3887 domain-containing protein n=1 Tax=Methanococcoides seepicolus TaxID=2828780 RepID=A0A9E4ZGQ6_9EURY|nr:DUF3887 domain-containing protein [Methanococcoides seepicolus]MCM1986873.1 DUF3887 domain-containing protein [Methanococcoides seepicolus]
MKARTALLMAFVFLVAIICSGCTSIELEGVSIEDGDIAEYAEPIAENTLQGLNEKNYTKFSANFNPTMKKAITEDLFLELTDIVHEEVGNYTSKELAEITVTDRHSAVVYNVAFEKEPEGAIFRLIFQEKDGQRELKGMWIDSPKMRKRLALER